MNESGISHDAMEVLLCACYGATTWLDSHYKMEQPVGSPSGDYNFYLFEIFSNFQN
jgi:hypothetical protein